MITGAVVVVAHVSVAGVEQLVVLLSSVSGLVRQPKVLRKYLPELIADLAVPQHVSRFRICIAFSSGHGDLFSIPLCLNPLSLSTLP